MKGEVVLLEPYYRFELEVPSSMAGRAMTDISRMRGTVEESVQQGDGLLLKGRGPVEPLSSYQKELAIYTKGAGSLSLCFDGYDEAKEAQRIKEETGYDPDRDTENPSGSVFCRKGAGFLVPWQEAESWMHTLKS